MLNLDISTNVEISYIICRAWYSKTPPLYLYMEKGFFLKLLIYVFFERTDYLLELFFGYISFLKVSHIISTGIYNAPTFNILYEISSLLSSLIIRLSSSSNTIDNFIRFYIFANV